MYICTYCDGQTNDFNFICSKCGREPAKTEIDAFISFIAKGNNQKGFDPNYFPLLWNLEKNYFWFSSRNKLITWSMKKYFSDATSILDVGCGTGNVLSAIKRAFPNSRLFGADIFIEGLRFAQERNETALLFQMDAKSIPFRDEFDIVGAFDLIEHIDNDELALNQMYKATRPGGGIIITTPQHPFLWSNKDEHAHHYRRYNSKELICKVENAGFKIEKITSFVTFLFPFIIASRYYNKIIKTDYQPLREFHINNFSNNLFYKTMRFESNLIKLGFSFPFGTSLLLVGRKES
jgi:SAM-dependent methyltransferase